MNPFFVFTGEFNSTSSQVNDLNSFYDTRIRSLFREDCPFCHQPCKVGQYETPIMDEPGEFQLDRLSVCSRCGWWSYENDDPDPYAVSYWSSCALLRDCAVDDADASLRELINYIDKNNAALSDIHPTKFEELVGSVFSASLGYRVEYCSYGRPDLGVDLVAINTDNNKPIAIQVKRYKKPIELGQIHQFYGAMVDSDHKTGVFVTSGRFRSGAELTAKRLSEKSEVKIDLVDGKKFLEFLNVANSKSKSVYDNLLSHLETSTGRIQTKWIIDGMRE